MKRILFILTAVILAIFSAFPVFANAEQPPCFTIVVFGAPEDLTISYSHPETELFDLGKDKRGWESYYKCEYYKFGELALTSPEEIIRGELHVKSDSENINFTLPAPKDIAKVYNNIFTLDLGEQSLKNTNTAGRAVLLVFMRLVITLAVEGAVFFIVGFREKRTWLVFLIINLITQSLLIIPMTGYIPPNVYWMFVYYGGEALIFAVEAIVYAAAAKEERAIRRVMTAVLANTASMIIGAWMLSNLPM